MTDLHATELTIVVGGTSKIKKDDLSLQLTTLQTSLKDLTSASNNNGGNANTMMLMMMAMAMRSGPTVIAGPAGALAAAPGAVVNISTRLRRC
jgi:hypothetical protein